MRVAVRPHGEIFARAASALAAHPDVEVVGLIGRRPARAWAGRMVEIPDARGFEVVMGVDGREDAAGAVLVTIGEAPDDGPTVTWADPTGLARALAGPDRTAARTVHGTPSRTGTRLAFPAPIGYVRADVERDGVLLAPIEGPLAGVLALRPDGTSIAVVDDAHFLHAVCLAAGAFVAAMAVDGPHPVWEAPARYLAACESLGMVTAETVTNR